MRKKIFLFLLLTILTLVGIAQFNEQKVMFLPIDYNCPTESVITKNKKESIPGLFWIVYSDRDNNNTYETPNCKTIKKTISFLDKFYILEETDNYLHLVKDIKMNYAGILSKKAEDYGWIKKDKLLLWTHCLVDEKNQNKIGIILKTSESAISDFKDNNKLFQNSPKNNSINFDFTKFFDICYIYKITKDSVLLSYTPFILPNKNRTNITIKGWVSKKQIVILNSRIFIEPNWDINATKERAFKGINAVVLSSNDFKNDYSNGELIDSNSIIWIDNQLEKRNIGAWMRIPVLSINDNYNKVGILCYIDSLNQKAKNIKIIKNFNEEFLFIEGYTPIKIKGMNHPPFQRVLFLEKLEFAEIVSDMKKVMEAGSGSSRREKLENIWIEVLKKHIGNVNECEIKEMTMEDINMKVYGLPGTSDILKDTKLGDFKNHSIVTDDEITRYINNISRKYEKLHSIFSKDSYEYSFRSNDNTYYWISENLIP